MSLQIGIVWLGGSEWQGGRIYCENLLRVLMELKEAEGGFTVSVILDAPAEAGEVSAEFDEVPKIYVQSFRRRLMAKFREEKKEFRKGRIGNRTQKLKSKATRIAASRLGGKTEDSRESDRPQRPREVDVYREMIDETGMDFLFPLPANVDQGVPGAAWIPDFQHCFLPGNFTEEELAARNRSCEKRSTMEQLILSSETCLRDFRKEFPAATAQLHVWRFCSVIPDSVFASSTEETRKKYHLPERFFVVPNQFWKHKDHLLVLEALAILGKEGISPVVVFTGALKDGRGSGHIDRFLQMIQELDLNSQTHILGFLDRNDQQNLMRRAEAVIQPSQFEGWSTVVEDCKSMGQRLILSDLEVHKEQAPPHSIFFTTASAPELAAAIQSLCTEPGPGWVSQGAGREAAIIPEMAEKRLAVAGSFLKIVREVLESKES